MVEIGRVELDAVTLARQEGRQGQHTKNTFLRALVNANRWSLANGYLLTTLRLHVPPLWRFVVVLLHVKLRGTMCDRRRGGRSYRCTTQTAGQCEEHGSSRHGAELALLLNCRMKCVGKLGLV